MASIIIVNGSDCLVRLKGLHMVLPHWRTCAQELGVQWMLSELFGLLEA